MFVSMLVLGKAIQTELSARALENLSPIFRFVALVAFVWTGQAMPRSSKLGYAVS